jgi:hypothetical protein
MFWFQHGIKLRPFKNSHLRPFIFHINFQIQSKINFINLITCFKFYIKIKFFYIIFPIILIVSLINFKHCSNINHISVSHRNNTITKV